MWCSGAAGTAFGRGDTAASSRCSLMSAIKVVEEVERTRLRRGYRRVGAQ
jgi:hypothetical protein